MTDYYVEVTESPTYVEVDGDSGTLEVTEQVNTIMDADLAALLVYLTDGGYLDLITSFLALTDTPSAYVAKEVVRVNAAGSALETEDEIELKSLEITGDANGTDPVAVNVLFGTGAAPTPASTYPNGTLYFKYTT
jgi:hypothetical protein